MKTTAVKKFSAVIITIVLMFAFASNAFAETIQDRLEQELNNIANQYESADPETQESLQDQFSSLLENAGLGDIDLGSLGDSDIGEIISGLGDNLALDSVVGLFTDAIESGIAMVEDVVNGGLGTSDGSNTATTNPSNAGGSPNVIIANPTPESSTVAVGVPDANMPVTNAPTTYDPGTTTAANIVGAGVTTAGTTAPAVEIDDTMSTSSIAVLVVLSVSTVAVIVAIVIFFVLKKK